MNDFFQISPEFIEENSNICQHMPSSSAPFSKHARSIRINEVEKLHFQYGYSARKISVLLKINRNTINKDLKIIYKEAYEKLHILNPEDAIMRAVFRLQSQRTRLVEKLDCLQNENQKIAIERLIVDLDTRISNIYFRLTENEVKKQEEGVLMANRKLEEIGNPERCISYFSLLKCKKETYEKVLKLLKQDYVSY